MICTYATQKEKLMRRQNESECENKISSAGAGVIEVRICRSKSDACAQVKMQSPCACQNAMRMRSSKRGAHAQAKKDAHAQAKMRSACEGLNEVRMRRKK